MSAQAVPCSLRLHQLGSPIRTRTKAATGINSCTGILQQTSYIKSLIKCKTSTAESLPEGLSSENLEKWQASRKKLVELGLSGEQADRVLGKSSGYIKSPYWGEKKEQLVPTLEEVTSILEFLRSMGLGDADLSAVLNKFPEVLGCKLEAEIQQNVGILDSTWGISGGTLKNLLLRKPQVLGYNVDCKGDCMAECTRCWARF